MGALSRAAAALRRHSATALHIFFIWCARPCPLGAACRAIDPTQTRHAVNRMRFLIGVLGSWHFDLHLEVSVSCLTPACAFTRATFTKMIHTCDDLVKVIDSARRPPIRKSNCKTSNLIPQK